MNSCFGSRPLRRLAAPVLLLLLAAAGSSPALAASAPPNPTPGLPVYLALGDSIANGQESAPAAGDYWGTVANWQANGYVAQLHDHLKAKLDCLPAASTNPEAGCRQLRLLNLSRSSVPEMNGAPAKPGVTTQVMMDEQLPQAIALLQARNHDMNPRNDVEVLTLTVGGNDVFGPVTAACLSGVTPECVSTIGAAFTAFSVNYSSILGQLREAAGPETAIVTMTYYNTLPYCYIGVANPQGAAALGNFVLEGVPVTGLGPVGFNGLISAISHQNGATVADTFGALGTGDFVGGSDCLHPNKSGHTKIASVFEQALTI
jgi:lysophospholipase L1-like esterase